MSTFVKIKALKSSLSSSESKIAEFVLNSSNAVRDLSSQELAKVTGVSQSSIIKFCQKLGYKGYPTFKLAIIDSLSRGALDTPLHGEIKLNDSLSQIAEKLLNSKMSVLSETKKLNENAPFEQAVALIKGAKRIVICGLGGSALVGLDFASKLQKLGMPAIASSDVHAQLAYVTTFSKDDLVFAISESGATREIVAITQQAKDNHCKIISLTKYGITPVSDISDINLYSVAENESVRLSSILARTAQEFVIDILFIALTQSSKQSREYLERSNKVVKQFRK